MVSGYGAGVSGGRRAGEICDRGGAQILYRGWIATGDGGGFARGFGGHAVCADGGEGVPDPGNGHMAAGSLRWTGAREAHRVDGRLFQRGGSGGDGAGGLSGAGGGVRAQGRGGGG